MAGIALREVDRDEEVGEKDSVRVFSGEGSYPFRKQVPEALTLADHFRQTDHHFRVPVIQFQPSGIFGCQLSFLPGFHRPGDGCSTGNGVHAVHVAEGIGFDDRFHIVDPAIAAKGRQGFILGSPVECICLERSFLDFRDPLAAIGAAETGVSAKTVLLILLMTFEMLVIEFDSVDGFITVEDPAVEILSLIHI